MTIFLISFSNLLLSLIPSLYLPHYDYLFIQTCLVSHQNMSLIPFRPSPNQTLNISSPFLSDQSVSPPMSYTVAKARLHRNSNLPKRQFVRPIQPLSGLPHCIYQPLVRACLEPAQGALRSLVEHPTAVFEPQDGIIENVLSRRV